jgi:hypothetical protein
MGNSAEQSRELIVTKNNQNFGITSNSPFCLNANVVLDGVAGLTL